MLSKEKQELEKSDVRLEVEHLLSELEKDTAKKSLITKLRYLINDVKEVSVMENQNQTLTTFIPLIKNFGLVKMLFSALIILIPAFFIGFFSANYFVPHIKYPQYTYNTDVFVKENPTRVDIIETQEELDTIRSEEQIGFHEFVELGDAVMFSSGKGFFALSKDDLAKNYELEKSTFTGERPITVGTYTFKPDYIAKGKEMGADLIQTEIELQSALQSGDIADEEKEKLSLGSVIRPSEKNSGFGKYRVISSKELGELEGQYRIRSLDGEYGTRP